MKVKEDFVTNSSSTSFILSMKEDVDKNNFMKGIGVTGEFPLASLFEDLFCIIQSNKKEISEYLKEDGTSLDKFLTSEGYDKEAISKVNDLITSGRKVYYGQLRSDGETSAEVFFCMESFLICEEDIYFNGEIGGW